MESTTNLPALPPPDAEAASPRRTPLLAERSDFLEGDAPAAAKVEAFLAQAFAAAPAARVRPRRRFPGSATRSCRTIRSRPTAATSWTSSGTCRREGVTRWRSPPTTSSSTSVPSWKPAGPRPRWRGGCRSSAAPYRELAAKGLVPWETAQDIGAVKAPGVQKNSTPSLTQPRPFRCWRRFRPTPCRGCATWP